MRFDPEGITGNPEIPFAKSMPDYIMRWLASRFIDDLDELEELGIMTPEVRARKEAQQSLFADDGPRRLRGQWPRQRAGGNGSAEPAAQAEPAAARRAAEALTDSPPVIPAKLHRPRPRPRLRAVRRHDAADRLLLHLLELREQHRLRLRLTSVEERTGRSRSRARATLTSGCRRSPRRPDGADRRNTRWSPGAVESVGPC